MQQQHRHNGTYRLHAFGKRRRRRIRSGRSGRRHLQCQDGHRGALRLHAFAKLSGWHRRTGSSGGALQNFDGTLTLTNWQNSGKLCLRLRRGDSELRREYSLSDCTLSGNDAGEYGGAIQTSTTVVAVIDSCTLSDNNATLSGGAISNGGSLTLTSCTLSGNDASVYGGGLENGETGTATLTGCTLSGNTAKDLGGGVHNTLGTIALTGCTF